MWRAVMQEAISRQRCTHSASKSMDLAQSQRVARFESRPGWQTCTFLAFQPVEEEWEQGISIKSAQERVRVRANVVEASTKHKVNSNHH